MRRVLKKSICLLGCIVLAFSILSISRAEDNRLKVVQGANIDQTVRVLLTRLAGRDRLDFTLTAPYKLVAEDDTVIHFQAGSQITLKIIDDIIYLFYQEMGQRIGKTLSLEMTGESDNANEGLQVTNFPALYAGDLNLSVLEGCFQLVLSIHVEDYLLGVVPYEMGEAFPLEALKAQAIAARTYALQRQNEKREYDLVDNTNDQAYKGYIEGNVKSEQAVKETRGLCGYYKGKLAQCYYSASNGGQMELVQNVWETRGALDYYTFGKDPYDIANPESMVRKYKLLKSENESNQSSTHLNKLVFNQLEEKIKKLGYTDEEEQFWIESIDRVEVNSPSADGSSHMTNLHIELTAGFYVQAETIDMNPEEVYLFEDTRTSLKEENPDSLHENGFLLPIIENFTLDIPIFPVAEEALSLSINSNYQNEIWSVAEEKDAFVIEVRRYGHGVGMSQRGAQWMAAEYGKTYQEILEFYYPGMDLIQYPESKRTLAKVEEALAATPGVAPTATPRPTLMPVTQTPLKGQWFAVVTEIADDSSLNLREEPSLNSNILMRLYKGQRLLVLNRADEGWLHVQTDAAEGYVSEKYLTKE